MNANANAEFAYERELNANAKIRERVQVCKFVTVNRVSKFMENLKIVWN
jgi:hypothetical protein